MNAAPAARLLERRIAWLTVVVPSASLPGAIALATVRRVTVVDLGLFAVFYLVTMLGITAGFHRLFAHRAYDAGPAIRALLGAAGSMAMQGPLLFWVAAHRRHHRFSDEREDPHSPNLASRPLVGLWHAHVGWMLEHDAESLGAYVPDLARDDATFRIHRLYVPFALAGLVLPAMVGGIAAWTWWGALSGLLWGGLVRALVVHHATWAVNSICHRFGRRPHATRDESRNNALVALLTLGEGWHNNHHASPSSARHGSSWHEVDVTYAFIRALATLRLARNVKLAEGAQARERR